jgi:PncC family amidohydrolase
MKTGSTRPVSTSSVPRHDADEIRADQVSRLGRILTRRTQTLAVAESLTGGLLVQMLARTEGSGDWLRGGVVAYASEVKHDLLGVTAAKVVSAAAAQQMARGALDVLGADVAVAVTGVAGPDPQDGEPPGTVWVGLADGEGATADLLQTSGGPEEICQQTIDAAIDRLLARLEP